MKVLKWIGRHIAELAGAAVALLLGFLAWGSYNRKLGSLKDTIEVEKAKQEIAGLQAKRKVLLEMSEAKQEEIDKVDRDLKSNKLKIVQVQKEVSEIDDDQIENEFRDLGF
jgi:uncharacterized protein HemX